MDKTITVRVSRGSSTSGPRLRRIRVWGDPIMVKWGFDINQVNTTNFQAVRTWNPETGWGAVSNFIRIPHSEVLKIRDLQFPETTSRGFFDRDSKMEWLCSYRGSIYMYEGAEGDWKTDPSIRWGTVSLGGNLVQIEGYEDIVLSISGEAKRSYRMARLVGFTNADWGRSLQELLDLGLVHRCFCVYGGNRLGDSPKGIVYSPFFSPAGRDFAGTAQVSSLYLPEMWLEPEGR